MTALANTLRNDLGRVIGKARRLAEGGARKALESLAVGRHEPFGSMSPDERSLRNRLRARGRQLGDVRDKQRGAQSIERLAHEIAYEHWHRMLFSRFLAENELLIHPEHGVAISLGEVEELARETGADPRAVAAGFAQDSLPQIFRTGDPVLEVTLAPETRQALDKLLDSLPTAVFIADDSLGWTYQYWQAEKKKAINASGKKIGADELPAVTQLFTEHYMVLFLYHNTIGAWHAGKVLAANPKLAETAGSEEELRQAVALITDAGPSPFAYLRFVREKQDGDEDDQPTGPWRPAAGVFEGWPKSAQELKVLDPCCGSGHFLVVGFKLLVRLRMHEEGLNVEDAIRAVLSDNLHGLELDPRCTQIAAFNLAMAAWKKAGRPIELPALNIACSGLALGSTKKEWTALAGDDERLRAGMERLYDLFEQAPELGSLINPKAFKADMFEADFSELQPLLEQALARESGDVEGTERAVAAQGMARAAELLSGEYTLVVTNVPYLATRKQSPVVQQYCTDHFPDAKNDLGVSFMLHCTRLAKRAGVVALVMSQYWLFKSSYTEARQTALQMLTWNLIGRLGAGAFETVSGEVVNVCAGIWTRRAPVGLSELRAIDLVDLKSVPSKAEGLANRMIIEVAQLAQLKHPGARIITGDRERRSTLESETLVPQGVKTGDDERWRRFRWEVAGDLGGWVNYQTTVRNHTPYGGRNLILDWRTGGDEMVRPRVENVAVGLKGVAISQSGSLLATLYTGERFDSNVAPIVPKDQSLVPALWAFCTSKEYLRAVRQIDQSFKVTNGPLVQVPFDEPRWTKQAAEKYPNGLPEPQSDDPTQWLFHGHPAKAEPPTVLQVAVGRLLGYRWPPEPDPEMRLADEAREWVARCDALKDYADEDGIVCLAATRGERSAADRLRELLSAAFGSDWSTARERELLAIAGDGKKPAASLEIWLRDKFFEAHCKLFHHRPFVWHLWDGNRDGFHCLVNAHKITGPDGEGRRTLEAIAYSYLGDWIDRQKADQREDKEGADARLAAAQDLQGQLEKMLKGEPPYDLFVRWKPLQEQAIGWAPDINDGVRLNIRPFMKAALRTGGKKGAGILRWKPTIKWAKDRGKEPRSLRPKEDFPWFWGCSGDGNENDRGDYTPERAARAEFDGNRWNDLHYSLAVKQAARDAKE